MPTTKRTNRKTGHIIEIYPSTGSRRKFYYRLKGANGEVMMHSEVRGSDKHPALRDVKRTVIKLAQNMEIVRVVDCTAFPFETVFEKTPQSVQAFADNIADSIKASTAYVTDRTIPDKID